MSTNPVESPPLTKAALEHAAEICRQLDADLKEIAAAIARNSEAETIIVPHVKQAHQALKHAGLRPHVEPPLYLRPDVWVGLGSLLIGFAPTVSSLSKDVIESGGEPLSKHPVNMWIWMITVPFVIFGIGAFMAGCGWRHSGKNSV